MQSALRLLSRLVPLLALLFAVSRADAAAPAPDSNAVWLTRVNVTTPRLIDRVPEMASRLQDLGVRYLFVNSATLNAQGATTTKAEHLVPFLNALGGWERANNYKFTVLVWLTGTVDPAETRFLDLANPSTRGAIVAEAGKYLDPHAPGGFLVGVRRPADGVMLDLQPVGGNAGLFKNYLQLLKDLRKATAPGEQKIGVAAHKLGFEHVWQLSPENYNQLAHHADYLAGLNYNSGKQTPEEYQTWMTEQTQEILRAVSGLAWKNKPGFPAPQNGVKVFIGFPAFPFDKRNHLDGVESIPPAAAGAKAALASLDSLSRSYFEGAAVHAHGDGESQNGYARWAADWEDFRSAWLAP